MGGWGTGGGGGGGGGGEGLAEVEEKRTKYINAGVGFWFVKSRPVYDLTYFL